MPIVQKNTIYFRYNQCIFSRFSPIRITANMSKVTHVKNRVSTVTLSGIVLTIDSSCLLEEKFRTLISQLNFFNLKKTGRIISTICFASSLELCLLCGKFLKVLLSIYRSKSTWNQVYKWQKNVSLSCLKLPDTHVPIFKTNQIVTLATTSLLMKTVAVRMFIKLAGTLSCVSSFV